MSAREGLPVAQKGAGPVGSRLTPIPRAAAAVIRWSYFAQLAAGYAAGLLASKPDGLVLDFGSGATLFQNSEARMRSTPSVLSSSSVLSCVSVVPKTSRSSSWKVDSCWIEACALDA